MPIQEETIVTCMICQYKVKLGLVGGQYQFTWKGMCNGCGVMWTLSCEEDLEEEQE